MKTIRLRTKQAFDICEYTMRNPETIKKDKVEINYGKNRT